MFARSMDVDVQGIRTVCHLAGSGQPLLMLHGSGPGASADGTWRFILDRLVDRYAIYAPDLIGFGLSASNPAIPAFDANLWLEQALAVIDRMPEGPIVVFGHSLSGFTALRLPSRAKQIAGVLTTGTMGARFEQNAFTVLTWKLPGTPEELRIALECLVHDKSQIDDEFVRRRFDLLYGGDAARSFEMMFPGDKQQYIDSCVLSDDEIAGITCPVLLTHGKSDVIIRASDTTLNLARRIPLADVHLLAACGHLPATERPETMAALATAFFQNALQTAA